MSLDPVLLSRIQFAMTISFHYIFPPLTIGLGAVLVLAEGAFLRTGDRLWEEAARFWTRLFAVNFALGVATGIVMEFQFGTNWASYSRFVGDVFGSALAAEGIFAFFLESGFLAILVFGWSKVTPRVHFFSTCMVFLGSIFSSVWIVVANSWQQTPAGHRIVAVPGGFRAEVVDFWAMVFNPSSVPRLLHVWTGALLLGAFFVMSICAYYILRGRHLDFSRRSFKLALCLGTLGALLAPLTGDVQARIVARLQPAKLAAFEGHFHTGTGGAPLVLAGWPDEEGLSFPVAIPKALSLMLHFDPDKPVPGLDQFPPADRPPVWMSFMTFHAMVALGMAMLALLAAGWWRLHRGTLWEDRRLLWAFVFSVALPMVANQAGWFAAEVGRQPWTVYGLLRTADSVSRSVPARHILASMLLFAVIYLALTAVWLLVLDDKIRHGPDEPSPEPS